MEGGLRKKSAKLRGLGSAKIRGLGQVKRVDCKKSAKLRGLGH